MSISFNYKDSAHLQSNYKENWIHKITDVIVDVKKVGVSEETVRMVINATRNNIPFMLCDTESVVTFIPGKLISIQNNEDGSAETKYKSLHQMMMTIKLIILTHKKVLIPDLKWSDKRLKKEIQKLLC